MKVVVLLISHLIVAAVAFAAGIYSLPILTAPESPSITEIEKLYPKAEYITEFTPELKGSDTLHWGKGKVSLSQNHISLHGELAPGPDYKLYLSPKFVETEAEFEALKQDMIAVADVRTFDNFLVEINQKVNLAEFNTVVVWCESFGEFITAAKYR